METSKSKYTDEEMQEWEEDIADALAIACITATAGDAYLDDEVKAELRKQLNELQARGIQRMVTSLRRDGITSWEDVLKEAEGEDIPADHPMLADLKVAFEQTAAA